MTSESITLYGYSFCSDLVDVCRIEPKSDDEKVRSPRSNIDLQTENSQQAVPRLKLKVVEAEVER